MAWSSCSYGAFCYRHQESSQRDCSDWRERCQRSGSRAAGVGCDAEYTRQKTRIVSVKFPMSNSADVTRWRISLLVSLEAGCLPSGDLHVGQSQHAPPVSRSVLSAFAVILAHFICQLLAQNSQLIFVPREPASQHATTSIFPDLGIFDPEFVRKSFKNKV